MEAREGIFLNKIQNFIRRKNYLWHRSGSLVHPKQHFYPAGFRIFVTPLLLIPIGFNFTIPFLVEAFQLTFEGGEKKEVRTNLVAAYRGIKTATVTTVDEKKAAGL